MPQNSKQYLTNRTPSDSTSESNVLNFVIRNLLAKVRTSLPVMVKGVTNSGGVSPIGYVNIQPLVSMLDGEGNVFEHGIIYNVPYMRIQGGNNAIIIDPKIGDIGIASFCDRDISTVKSTSNTAPPASKRKHDFSDAIYLHSIIAGAPTQYIQFTDSGINVVSPQKVTVIAPEVDMTTSLLKVTGDIIDNSATNTNSIAQMRSLYNTHVHSDPQGGTTGSPSNSM